MTLGLRLEAAASAFALAAGALAAAEGSGRPSLLEEVRAGPWKGVEEIVFATRLPYDDPHWYANIGTYCDDERKKAYAGNGAPDASGLYALLLRSREVRTILDARGGSVRDPQVAYDAEKILFSYRPAGTDRYHLYEVRLDGSGLRQLTSGDFDDIEPAYLPDGDIVFVSTRCRRWVNCWMTEVATLHRANADGSDIRAISANTEHDNTPWVLPDGRILYTRWEYVDRSQVEFHHLWVMFPDGTGQTIYYGNLHPGVVMIDAKPIPGTAKVLANFSPGHGVNEHAGIATVVDPAAGPDDRSRARALHRGPLVRDPYPISESCFLAARDDGIALLAEGGRAEILWRSPGPAKAHEPRPVERREREPILAARSDPRKGTGAMLLSDVATSRNLPGVRRGEIRELLVLESLPKPVNFSGGPDLTSWLGTFTLERVLGTVPVEEDGSAYFEVPAGRQIFFVALDARGLSVKRMHSFTCAMPGETVGCVGCHEPRTRAPENRFADTLAALRGPPRKIQPFDGFPQVLDYHRDVQPILDRRCVPCHGYERREGKTLLGGDLGPEWAHGYFSLLARRQVADGRNGLGNQPPRSVGSSASPLLEKLRGGHHDARATEEEWRTAWLWIESGAPYAGTYAALRNAEAQAREPAAVGRAP
ncbi:MAG: HzsA-related protein, partial [Planctomycetota bacterium]